MKNCKYCNSNMISEYETNSQNNNKYKAFHICKNCGAVCDEEIIESKGRKEVLNEKWYEGKNR